MRRTFKPKMMHGEFELDLAPLLSVMVKLVPVLLLSSAFVQTMIIETDLPQVIKEAQAEQKNIDKPIPKISILIKEKLGILIVVDDPTKGRSETMVKVNTNGENDFKTLHEKLIAVKTQYPNIFKIDLKPDSQVAYDDIIKVMDMARRARKDGIEFMLSDQKTKTQFMFPEITLANVIEVN